jgi:predicted RNA binding protein YcfA (HicA-like mRNA interferase family)
MKLSPVSPKKLVKVLGFLGYSQVRRKGSHIILEHRETRKITVVPVHSGQEIGVGLLGMILRETGLSREEYFELLRRA